MVQILYIIAFALLAILAISNLVRNLIALSQTTTGRDRAMVQRPVPHPELLDENGKISQEPLLVMRSLNVEDARSRLDAIYEASPDTVAWQAVGRWQDITYHKAGGIAKIAINRPEVRNAFRPQTIEELLSAFRNAQQDTQIGVILLTGVNPAPDGKYAFCAGGDQKVRATGGYLDSAGTPRLNVLELQKLIRSIPKVVIALVAGYAIGGCGL